MKAAIEAINEGVFQRPMRTIIVLCAIAAIMAVSADQGVRLVYGLGAMPDTLWKNDPLISREIIKSAALILSMIAGIFIVLIESDGQIGSFSRAEKLAATIVILTMTIIVGIQKFTA